MNSKAPYFIHLYNIIINCFSIGSFCNAMHLKGPHSFCGCAIGEWKDARLASGLRAGSIGSACHSRCHKTGTKTSLKNLTFVGPMAVWLRSLMDRTRDSGSLGGGSIPSGATTLLLQQRGFFVPLRHAPGVASARLMHYL